MVLVIQLKKRGEKMKSIYKYYLLKDFIKKYKLRKIKDNNIISILEGVLVDYEVELINEQIELGNEIVKSIKRKKKGGGKK